MRSAPKLDDLALLPQVGLIDCEAHSLNCKPEIVSAEAEIISLIAGFDAHADNIPGDLSERRLINKLNTHFTPQDSDNFHSPMSVMGINETLPGALNFC